MQESPFYEIVLQRGIEQGTKQGMERGMERGIEQGEARAKQMALLKILHHQFQTVPETLTTWIQTLRDPAHLDTLFEQALNAENLEDIDWETDNA